MAEDSGEDIKKKKKDKEDKKSKKEDGKSKTADDLSDFEEELTWTSKRTGKYWNQKCVLMMI